MSSNKDHKMMSACTNEETKKLFSEYKCDHPLDSDIQTDISSLMNEIKNQPDDYALFRYREKTDKLWGSLIEKAIKCLRFYDNREPFLKHGEKQKKSPTAYGVDALREYYSQYTAFEKLLYGSSQYYRDHVIHVLRTWLSGVELLVKNPNKVPLLIDQITIYEKNLTLETLNRAEKLSIWTLIALTHDLGYPLQTAKKIIDKTRDMVSTFITNPNISVDFSFHGVQNYMNDFIVRLMSSKMISDEKNAEIPAECKRKTDCERKDECTSETKNCENPLSVARLQPKYYFKFQKSLEQNQHGILSTLIIYKLLTYFLESDYNINEDYKFGTEERRQFYIRREILRAIASHTCNDVYQLYLASFSLLLRVCDDTQEWGRKNITELYEKAGTESMVHDIDFDLKPSKDTDEADKEYKCTIEESIKSHEDTNVVATLIKRFRTQSLIYVAVFRDGQDTDKRDFSFIRKLKIQYGTKDKITLTLTISKDRASSLDGEIKYESNGSENEDFGKKFFEKIPHISNYPKAGQEGFGVTLFGTNDEEIFCPEKGNKLPAFEKWRKGKFSIELNS